MKTSRRMTSCARFARCAFAVTGFAGIVRADRLDGLVKHSPFAPDKAAGAMSAQPVATSRIEFGGYMTLEGKTLVSLSDGATGQSVWVGVQDPKAEYFVENLDPSGPTISLKLNGKTLLLGLRKVNTDAAPPAQPTATVAATVRDPGAPATEAKPPEPAAMMPANRIAPQTLHIPKRVDDPA